MRVSTVLLGFVLVWPLHALGSPGSVPREQPEVGELKGGEVREIPVTLDAGRYVEIVLAHEGLRTRAALYDPDGARVGEADFFPGESTGYLYAVTRVSGEHLLRLRAEGPAESSGTYRWTVRALRPSTDSDPHRVAAERAYVRGYAASLERESLPAALAHYEASLELWRLAGDAEGRAKTWHGLGYARQRLGDLAGARAAYEAAVPFWRQAAQPAHESDSLYQIARIRRSQGRLDEALRDARRALALARDADDPRREATAVSFCGTVYRLRYELGAALEAYERALAIYEEQADRRGQARALTSLGIVYNRLGEYPDALDHHLRSLRLLEEVGERRGLDATFNNLATTYTNLGRFDQALFYYRRALDLNRGGERRGRTLVSLGWAQHFSKEPEKALRTFREAHDLLATREDRSTEASLLQNMARSLAATGRPAQARARFDDALVAWRELGDRRGVAATLAEMAELEVRQGAASKAIALAAESLALSRDLRHQRLEAYSLLVLGRGKLREGRPEEALAAVEEAVGVVESQRRSAAGYGDRAGFLASRYVYYEAWIEALMTLHGHDPGAGHDGRALLASEQARARGLADMLRDARIDAGRDVDHDLLEREQDLRRRLSSLDLRRRTLAAREPRPPELATVEDEIEEALAQVRTLGSRIRTTHPRYGALTDPATPELPAIRRHLLDPGTVLLKYALGERRSFVWLVEEAGVRSFELPARDEIESAARRLYGHLTARSRSAPGEAASERGRRVRDADTAFAAEAGELARTLLGPVASHLGDRRLAIVSEGALEYVPFAALPSPGNASYEPLVVRHEIVRLPSLAVLAELRRESPGHAPAPRTLVVVADPVFEPGDPRVATEGIAAELRTTDLRRLRYSAREAESIVAVAGNGGVRVALGFEASRQFLESELDLYRIVHFATHGLVDSRSPELSALALSMVDARGRTVDGFLRLPDIYQLRLNADLVVLSACQTALGREIRGEGLIGLTRGFMYAGAARVLASLWTVQDKATQVLMQRFYERFLRDGGAAAALRGAQVSMWRESRYEAPYYWAPFVLQGDWR